MVFRTVLITCALACFVSSGCVDNDTGSVAELDDDLEESPLSKTCLRCLCKVMGCNREPACSDNTCGVMHLTQGYWEMAYRKPCHPSNTAAYQKCSENVWCSTRTVQIYMKQYLPACEAKRPDRFKCENAVALHKFGQKRCDRNLTETTERKLHSCLDEEVWKWLGDEEEG